MEKFLCVFKLSKSSIFIGWTKLVLNALLVMTSFAAMLFSAGLEDSIKKTFKADDSQLKFYSYLILLTLFFIAHGLSSFVLIIGSINHHRVKVLVFVIVDSVFTLLLLFAVYLTSFNVLFLLFAIIQFYLLLTVFSFWQQLNREHRTRMENQEDRKRRQPAARIKSTVPTASVDVMNELL